MAHNHRSDEGADKLYDLIADVRICMMTTIEPEGRLASRPMYCIQSDKSGDLWFFTRLASAKTAEISRDGEVNLAYADPSKQHTSPSPEELRWCAIEVIFRTSGRSL